jgi:hypothetical protein
MKDEETPVATSVTPEAPKQVDTVATEVVEAPKTTTQA